MFKIFHWNLLYFLNAALIYSRCETFCTNFIYEDYIYHVYDILCVNDIYFVVYIVYMIYYVCRVWVPKFSNYSFSGNHSIISSGISLSCRIQMKRFFYLSIFSFGCPCVGLGMEHDCSLYKYGRFGWIGSSVHGTVERRLLPGISSGMFYNFPPRYY